MATGAALLLSQGGARAQATPPRVVIVGAGFAGLSCAYELAAAGIVPWVLEARGRVGGRVRTVAHPGIGAHAEAGGEFIGEQHHVWGAYAQQFGLPLVSCFQPDTDDTRVVVDGVPLDPRIALRLYREMNEAFARMGEDARQVDAIRPWCATHAARWDHTAVSQVLDSMGLSPLCRRLLELHFSNENAVPTTQQSYLGLLATVQGGGNETYWTQTESLRCAAGNQRLAEALAASLPQESLKLRHPVQSIARCGTGFVVTCHNGARYTCDICVVAVPPSAWGHMQFEPALPAALNPQMGPAIKHLVWFDRVGVPGNQAVVMSDYEGMLWPMLHTGFGCAGEVFFSTSQSAARYRGLDPAARETLRATLRCQAPQKGDPVALSTQFVDWQAQRFTGAGYSFPALGEVTRCGPIWQSGVGPLQFIGEHTQHAFAGFMEGALRSGAGMAMRIVQQTSSVT